MTGGIGVKEGCFDKLGGVTSFESACVFVDAFVQSMCGSCVGVRVTVWTCGVQGGDVQFEVCR